MSAQGEHTSLPLLTTATEKPEWPAPVPSLFYASRPRKASTRLRIEDVDALPEAAPRQTHARHAVGLMQLDLAALLFGHIDHILQLDEILPLQVAQPARHLRGALRSDVWANCNGISNWFEGAQFLALYGILALCYDKRRSTGLNKVKSSCPRHPLQQSNELVCWIACAN